MLNALDVVLILYIGLYILTSIILQDDRYKYILATNTSSSNEITGMFYSSMNYERDVLLQSNGYVSSICGADLG